MNLNPELTLDIQRIFTLDWKNITIPKVLNLQKGINGKLYLKKGFYLNLKLCLLNIISKKIEKKDYP